MEPDQQLIDTAWEENVAYWLRLGLEPHEAELAQLVLSINASALPTKYRQLRRKCFALDGESD